MLKGNSRVRFGVWGFCLLCGYQPDFEVKTGRMNPSLFLKILRFKINIGKLHFWINNLKSSRPQDVVVLDNEQNGKFNLARMRY